MRSWRIDGAPRSSTLPAHVPWPPKAGAPPASVEVTAFPNGESHECGVRVGIIISAHCSAASASPLSRCAEAVPRPFGQAEVAQRSRAGLAGVLVKCPGHKSNVARFTKSSSVSECGIRKRLCSFVVRPRSGVGGVKLVVLIRHASILFGELLQFRWRRASSPEHRDGTGCGGGEWSRCGWRGGQREGCSAT